MVLSPRVAWLALAAVLLVAGVWPFHEMLAWLPWGADATKWIARGSLDDPNWWRWATASKHFVGYRPITALSFVANHATTGYAGWGYRGTDLGLHLATGAATFAAYRALTGDRSVFGLVPVLVLFGHPAAEEVVPYSARRSYLLALALGLSAVVVWVHTLDAVGRKRVAGAIGAAVLVGAAVLSNEVAYAIVPVLALIAALAAPSGGPTPRWDRSAAMALAAMFAPIAVVTAAAIAARRVVLGTYGGYAKRFFAFVHDHTPMWRELDRWEPRRIAEACWRYTLDPVGVSGADPLYGHDAVLIVLTIWLGWVALGTPIARRADPTTRIRWVLAAWVLGSGAIVVLSQTWFWRQSYPVLVPLGMVVGLGLRDVADGLRQNRWIHLPGLAAGAGLLLGMGWNGPLWTGMDREAHQAAITGTPVVHQVERLLGGIQGPATVYLVAPARPTGIHIVRLWGDRYGATRKITFRVLGHLRPAGVVDDAVLTLSRDGGRPRLTLDRGLVFATTATVAGKGRTLEVDRLWRANAPSWLAAIDADDAWAIRIPQPPAGVEPVTVAPERDDPDADGPEPVSPGVPGDASGP
ncbi:MAG: hypothetical protein ABMB14_26865 [Myxococcota bacterium]